MIGQIGFVSLCNNRGFLKMILFQMDYKTKHNNTHAKQFEIQDFIPNFNQGIFSVFEELNFVPTKLRNSMKFCI